MQEIILKAILAGALIISINSILSIFVVWKKMAFFADSLAHSTILSIALGLLLSINISILSIITAVIVAIIVKSQEHKFVSIDSMLSILAHSFLSLGIIIISVNKLVVFNLHNYLFGNILSISNYDIYLLMIITLIFMPFLILSYKKLFLISLNKEIAKSDGIKTNLYETIFIIILSITISISVNIFGLLLSASILIIPTNIAINITTSIKMLPIYIFIISFTNLVLGILLSSLYDIPTTPTIVLCNSFFYIYVIFLKHRVK